MPPLLLPLRKISCVARSFTTKKWGETQSSHCYRMQTSELREDSRLLGEHEGYSFNCKGCLLVGSCDWPIWTIAISKPFAVWIWSFATIPFFDAQLVKLGGVVVSSTSVNIPIGINSVACSRCCRNTTIINLIQVIKPMIAFDGSVSHLATYLAHWMRTSFECVSARLIVLMLASLAAAATWPPFPPLLSLLHATKLAEAGAWNFASWCAMCIS